MIYPAKMIKNHVFTQRFSIFASYIYIVNIVNFKQMKKIELKSRKLLRKIFGGISLTAVAFTFQACYGPRVDPPCDVQFTGTVISKTTNLPIEGIKVAIDKGINYGFTDENGNFNIYTSVCNDCSSGTIKIHFLDVDGADNGHFTDKTMDVDFRCRVEVEINVELEEIQ